MSQFKSNYHKLWVVRPRINAKALDITWVGNKLLEYPTRQVGSLAATLPVALRDAPPVSESDDDERKPNSNTVRRAIQASGNHGRLETPSAPPPLQPVSAVPASTGVVTDPAFVGPIEKVPARPFYAMLQENPTVLQAEVVKLLSTELADLHKRLLDLRAESEAARVCREQSQQTIVTLRNELYDEQSNQKYERQRLESEVQRREGEVAKKEAMVETIWKWVQRDPGKDTVVDGVLHNPSMESVVPPWLVKKECQCGQTGSGAGEVTAEKEEEPS